MFDYLQMVRSKDNKRNHPSYPPLPLNWVYPAPPSVGPAAVSESSSAPTAAAESSSANSGSSSPDQDARIMEMRLRFERAQEEALSRIVWQPLNHPHQVDPQMEVSHVTFSCVLFFLVSRFMRFSNFLFFFCFC